MVRIPCPRLYIAAAVAMNTAARGVIRACSCAVDRAPVSNAGRVMVVADLQPAAVYVSVGDAVRLNCSVTASCRPPLNLSAMVVRRRSTGALVGGRVQLLRDDLAQFTFSSPARLDDRGNVYCAVDGVMTTDNATVDSPSTHIYVLSQYTPADSDVTLFHSYAS